MSQVKNLRAMFENKGDDPSPPDRGRSPAGFTSVSGGSASESPRPLSAVRTQFVAVHEKDGRVGLRRNPSHESGSPYRRPVSTDMETDFISAAAGDDMPKASRRLFVDDPILESPRSSKPSTENQKSSTDLMGAVNDEPSHNPDKNLDQEKSSPALTSAEPTQQTSSRDSTLASEQPKAEPKSKGARSETPATGTTASAGGRQTSKAIKLVQKGPAKTSATTKPTTTTVKRVDSRSSSKPQQNIKKEVASTIKASNASRKPAPVKVSADPGTGFVKPKPRSPTKPVALPSSFTAPTTSSASKGGSGKPTAPKQISLQPPAAARAPSRASATGGSVNRTIRKQPSTINSSSFSRPSIGPPPKRVGQDSVSNSKKTSHVDEGFLARMMRPTQASASKTTEKAPATPPRKLAARPSTSTANGSSRRASSVKRQAKLKGSAENTAISSNVSETEASIVVDDQYDVSHSSAREAASEGKEAMVTRGEATATGEGDSGLGALTSELNLTKSTRSAGVVRESVVDPVFESKIGQDTATGPAQTETTDTVEGAEVESAEAETAEATDGLPVETAQVETSEEVASIASEGQQVVQTDVEPSLENDNSKSGSAIPVEKTTMGLADSLTESFAESQAATQVSQQTSAGPASFTEDGRSSQVVVDEKEEATVDQMTPPADVIPEETAAVETAEEVAALAEAGDLTQVPRKSVPRAEGEVTGDIATSSEGQDTQEKVAEKATNSEDA